MNQCEICLIEGPTRTQICELPDCTQRFCELCLSQYFNGIVESMYYGYLPQIVCPGIHKGHVPYSTWSKYLSFKNTNKYKSCRDSLFTILCWNCDMNHSFYISKDELTDPNSAVQSSDKPSTKVISVDDAANPSPPVNIYLPSTTDDISVTLEHVTMEETPESSVPEVHIDETIMIRAQMYNRGEITAAQLYADTISYKENINERTDVTILLKRIVTHITDYERDIYFQLHFYRNQSK